MTYKINNTIGSCLRKFIVNLDRPQSFKGEFGFSNVDPKYVNKVESLPKIKKSKIYFDEIKSKISSDFEKKELLDAFSGNRQVLAAIEAYKKLYNSQFSCSPWGVNYLTTYSSIFPKGNKEGFKSEFYLDIELCQLKVAKDDDLPLTADGTIIEFESDNKNIRVTPNKIDISKLIAKRSKRSYKPNDINESEYYYKAPIAIKIECLDVISKSCKIRIFSKRNGIVNQVGLHVVVKNDVIKKAKVKIVDVVHTSNDKIAYNIKELERKIKYQCFNQALIDVEIIYERFILSDYLGFKKTKQFYMDYPRGTLIEEGEGSGFYSVYVDSLKEAYSECKLNGASVDNSGEITYLFRINLETSSNNERSGYGIGYSSAIHQNNGVYHQSSCFVTAKSRYFEPMHELCHSFGLTHVFEKDYNQKNRPRLIQGYSRNLMDYRENIMGNPNKNYDNMFVLEFWQWLDMSKDKNLR